MKGTYSSQERFCWGSTTVVTFHRAGAGTQAAKLFRNWGASHEMDLIQSLICHRVNNLLPCRALCSIYSSRYLPSVVAAWMCCPSCWGMSVGSLIVTPASDTITQACHLQAHTLPLFHTEASRPSHLPDLGQLWGPLWLQALSCSESCACSCFLPPCRLGQGPPEKPAVRSMGSPTGRTSIRQIITEQGQ